MFNRSYQRVGHFTMYKYKLQNGFKSIKYYSYLENLKQYQGGSWRYLSSKKKVG